MEVAQRLQQRGWGRAGWEVSGAQPCATLQSHPKAAKNHLEGQCK